MTETTTVPTIKPDVSGTPVLCRVADSRLAMRHVRTWATLVEDGVIPDPGCPALRMLAVSAFIVIATAGAPENLRVRPAFGVER